MIIQEWPISTTPMLTATAGVVVEAMARAILGLMSVYLYSKESPLLKGVTLV